jgi:glycosyltransferase involved in cell wall biosynthesis
MFNDRRVVVVMPAYNAARTLETTHGEVLAQEVVDHVILVDDASHDDTAKIAKTLDRTSVAIHPANRGYGANQKTCYRLALEADADVIVMVHPDYQYTPQLIPAMAAMIGNGLYHCVIGSRILGGSALAGGMPLWKYAANRALTASENLLLGSKLSEFHTGYRSYSRELLERLTLDRFSDDFVFDNQLLAQVLYFGYTVAEVSCPTLYFPDASSINFPRSVRYGLGCLQTAVSFRLARFGIKNSEIFPKHIEP